MLTWRLFGCLQQGLVRATSQVSSPKKDSTDIVSRQKWQQIFESWPKSDLLQTIKPMCITYIFMILRKEILVIVSTTGWLAFLGPNKREIVKREEL